MAFVRRTFLRGLVTLLPVALTLYLLWWIGSACERLAERVVNKLLPGWDYPPGTGLGLGVATVFALGLLMRAWIARWLFQLGEAWLQRIPFVRTVYGPLKDLAGFFRDDGDKQGFTEVVLVDLGPTQVMGFVTGPKIASLAEGRDNVTVFVPMSYQLGGFVLVVPRERTRRLDLSIQDGLRLALTAGVGG
jgi:uncharacterized membrane protein